MDDETLEIKVHKPAGYEASPRVQAALVELADALGAEAEEHSEVAGFSTLKMGQDLKPRLSRPEPLDFCLGLYRSSGETETCRGFFW